MKIIAIAYTVQKVYYLIENHFEYFYVAPKIVPSPNLLASLLVEKSDPTRVCK